MPPFLWWDVRVKTESMTLNSAADATLEETGGALICSFMQSRN